MTRTAVLGQLLLNGVVAGGIYSLVAVGFALIYRAVRFFNFAHGAVVALGAFVGYAVLHYTNGGVVLSAFAAGCAGSLAGVAIDRVAFRPLRRRGSPALVYLLASFGSFIVLQSVLALAFGDRPLLVQAASPSRGFHVGIGVITATQVFVVAAAACATALVHVLLGRTRLGLALRATADDTIGARAVGIDPERMIAVAFAIGSFIAGMGGMLIALETRLEPTMGMPLMLKAITASVIGGAGSTSGAILGGMLIGVAENLGVAWVSAGWKDAIAFGLLVIFLLLRPSGILATRDNVRTASGGS